MAFPVVVTTNESATPTASTTHIVNLPASLVSGNLILVLLDKGTPASTASFNTLAGWTELLDEAVPSGMAVWYRVSNGAEGATVTFTSTVAIRDAAITYQISGALDPTTQAPQLSTLATGTSANPNAATCTPTGGAKDYLWITFFGQTGEQLDDNSLTTVTPTGFTNPIEKTCGTAGTNLGGMIASAQRQLNAASLDAAAWTSSDATAWRAFTIAIHPAPVVPKTGSASGSIAWVGSATGITITDPNEGQPVGSIDWAGTVTGSAVHSASASGSISWAGAATAANVRSGSASAAIAWVGSSTGDTVYRWIDLPGTTGNYLSTPDAAALDIVGDLCIVAHIAPDHWTPTGSRSFVSKLVSTGNNWSYEFRLLASGVLLLSWSPDGTAVAALTAASTANLSSLANAAWKWVAVTLDVNDGAGGRDTRFWTSDNGATWTQLGATVHVAATTSIHAGTAPLAISGFNNGASQHFVGSVGYISVRNGIGAAGTVGGTEVFRIDTEVDLADVAPSVSSFTATTGQTVTVNRSGSPSTELVTFNPLEGGATGTIAWAGSATAVSTHSGAATRAVNWVGVVTGITVRSGASTGAIAWAGAATGTTVKSGASTGADAWAGAANGVAIHSGTVTGTVAWGGSANGAAPTVGAKEGSAAGTVTWSGSATGTRNSSGAASGSIDRGGVAIGARTSSGAATGSVAWAGSATGESPTVGVSDGSATGTITWIGTASGMAAHYGTIAGTITWTGAAAAIAAYEGAALGSLTWVGAATGVSPGQPEPETAPMIVVLIGPTPTTVLTGSTPTTVFTGPTNTATFQPATNTMIGAADG